MELFDLAPREVNFEISDIKLSFRPFRLADDVHGDKLCGGRENKIKVFKELDFEKISLLAWYQLTAESQKKIVSAKIEHTYFDPETGEKKTEKIELIPIEKFRNLFPNFHDQVKLLNLLNKCKGFNFPDMPEDLKDIEALKKWKAQVEAIIESIGLKPLTS